MNKIPEKLGYPSVFFQALYPEYFIDFKYLSVTNSKPMPYVRYLPLIALFAGVLVPLYLFGMLSEDVWSDEVFSFDRPLLLWMHGNATPLWDRVMIVFTRAGSAVVLTPVEVVIFIALLRYGKRLLALFWVIALAGQGLLNVSAKHTFERTRPDLWLSILPETTFSFPSAHAMHSMAFTAALIVLIWPTRVRYIALPIGLLFVAMVGSSRVYLGVHYPSDILAGWCASMAWVVGVLLIFQKLSGTRFRATI